MIHQMSSSPKKQSKNLTIELARVFFTTVIMLHHFRMYSDALPFGGGYMATDFFFILSGVFIYSAYQHTDSVTYIRKRYIRLISEYLPLNLLLMVIYTVVFKLSYNSSVWEIIRENLMLELLVPDSSARFNTPMWYLGYLLIGSLIVCIALRVFHKRFRPRVSIMIGMIPLFLYVVIMAIHGNGNVYPQYQCVFDIYPLIRSISGLSIGCFLGYAVVKRSSKSFSYSFFIILLILLTDIYLLIWVNGYTRYDILVYIFVIINVYVISAHKTEVNNVQIKKMILLIGRSSYCAYIIHFPIARIITAYNIFTNIDWKLYSLIFVIMIWLFAIISSNSLRYIITNLSKVISHHNNL